MIKRHLAAITAFVLIFAALPMCYVSSAYADFEIKDGVVVRYSGMDGNVIVPNNVTAIGDNAFSGNSIIRNLTLPESVKTIGAFAFDGCVNLTRVTFAEGLVEIGPNAFNNCQYLANATIPNSVEIIGNNAFASCYSLMNLKLGEGVRRIGDRAFAMCISIATVHIPESLAYLGDSAFSACYNLQKFTVSDANTTFAAFDDGVLYSRDGKALLAYPQSRIGAYSLRPGTTMIAGGAFSFAIGLLGLTGTQDVEYVIDAAFEGCTYLRDIYLPKAKQIRDFAFNACSSLKTARVGSADIGKYAFADCTMLNTVIISEGATFISDYAFVYCPNLLNLVLPASLRFIGSNVISYASDDTRFYCEYGSISHKYFDMGGMMCAPLPKPSIWAAEILANADRFAIANLQIGYQENATRYQFTLAIANFLEQYYGKKVDTIAEERECAIWGFYDTFDLDILWVNALGIVNGVGDDMFAPDSLLTREQAATLMYRVMLDVMPEIEIEEPDEPEPEAEDEEEKAEEKYEEEEKEDEDESDENHEEDETEEEPKDIGDESEDEEDEDVGDESEADEEESEEEKPDDYLGLINKYKDAATISSWALDAVKAMTDMGIMVGDGVNFNPKDPCTREMCIIMFSRLWTACHS